MKFLIALFALVAVASAQFELPTVVEGAKATLVGPSGTLHADTGAVVKTGSVLAPRLISPISRLSAFDYGTRILPSTRIIADPFLTSGLYF